MAENEFQKYNYLSEARSRTGEQFKNKEIIDRYLQLMLYSNIQLQDVFEDLMTKRSIDTATGAQLDIIGDIVGQPRELIDTDLISYFAFDGYPDAQSFGDLTDGSVGGLYYSLGDPLAGNTLLNDDQYRLFIKAKIIKNNTQCTPDQFLNFISFVFGVDTNSLIAEGGAEFTILIGKELNSFERLLLTYSSTSGGYTSPFVPKPVGVRINYGQFDSNDFFGFQGAPNAKGYGSVVYSLMYDGTLSYDGEFNYDQGFIEGGGKYATLF